MTNENMRYIKVDDWYFEIKTIKTIKVSKFGEPYSVTANCSLNGNKNDQKRFTVVANQKL